MFDAFFKDAAAAQRKLKLFWIAFFWLVTLTTESRYRVNLVLLFG